MNETEIPFASDTLPMDIPPRTKLFRLEPIRMGTAEGESFAGWLTRLARAHRVGVRTLLLQVLPDTEWKRAVCGSGGRWRVRCNVLDVPGRIVPWLSSATGIEDLSSLSLERWAELISGIGLLRPRRAWCPECLRRYPYERLTWTMRSVTVCSKHRLRLREHCGDCGFAPPRLRLGSSLDRCPRCGRWLALSSVREDACSEWDLHLAGEAGTLVSMEKPVTANSPAQIANGIRNAFPTWTQGEISKLLGIHDSFFALLRNRNKTMSFEFLCRVSFALRISMATLLMEDPDGWQVGTPRRGPWVPARRTLVQHEMENLRERLRDLLTDGCSSLRTASMALGRCRTTLLKHFPEEASELLRRSQARRKAPHFPFTEFRKVKNGCFSENPISTVFTNPSTKTPCSL